MPHHPFHRRSAPHAAVVGVALVGAIAAAPGTAATLDARSCYGAHYTNVEVLQPAPNHTIISASANGTGYVTRDEASPLKGAYGTCVLFNEVIDGKPNGELRCVRTDADGDKFLVTGKVKAYDARGAMTGTYTLTGLTGKWVGASGGGNFTEGPGSGKDNRHYFVCFDGEVRLR